MLKHCKFYKMHGCGNDFIIIDARAVKLSYEYMEHCAVTLCRHHFSIGADGVVFIASPMDSSVAYSWHFYNADGSRAEMCGNASRCVGYLATWLGIAPSTHMFMTDVGILSVCVQQEKSWVETQLTPPLDLALGLEILVEGTMYTVHYVNTGVPHIVLFDTDIASVDVQALGHALRYHPQFAPQGTNVNFVECCPNSTLFVRTYERGVERETYACGTGVSAAAYIAHRLGLTEATVHVTTTGKEELDVRIESGDTIFLSASVCLVYEGILINAL